MIINIDDDLSYKGALLNFKYEWTKKQLANGTITGTAMRVGLSRKGLQLLNKIDIEDAKKMKAPTYECIFCKSIKEIHVHHIDGVKYSPETEMMCEDCHKLFHSLNRKYKQP